MTVATELFHGLIRQGFSLIRKDSNLRIEPAPPAVLLAELRDHKRELLILADLHAAMMKTHLVERLVNAERNVLGSLLSWFNPASRPHIQRRCLLLLDIREATRDYVWMSPSSRDIAGVIFSLLDSGAFPTPDAVSSELRRIGKPWLVTTVEAIRWEHPGDSDAWRWWHDTLELRQTCDLYTLGAEMQFRLLDGDPVDQVSAHARDALDGLCILSGDTGDSDIIHRNSPKREFCRPDWRYRAVGAG